MRTHQIVPSIALDTDGSRIFGWACRYCGEFSREDKLINLPCPEPDYKDLLRRCLEAFKPVNAASLDNGGLRKGCVTLYETDATSVSLWQCPPSCPICEAVRVIGEEQ